MSHMERVGGRETKAEVKQESHFMLSSFLTISSAVDIVDRDAL